MTPNVYTFRRETGSRLQATSCMTWASHGHHIGIPWASHGHHMGITWDGAVLMLAYSTRRRSILLLAAMRRLRTPSLKA